MIRTRITVNSQPLIDMERFVSDFARITGDLGEEVGRKIVPLLLDEMQHYPPVPAGSTYKRTFRLRRGMKARIVRSGSEVQLIAENNTPYAKWVVGTFDRRRKYQTRKHARTGWVLLAATTSEWQDAFTEEYRKGFDRMIDSTAGKFSTVRRNR